jgi:hypothetical protein
MRALHKVHHHNHDLEYTIKMCNYPKGLDPSMRSDDFFTNGKSSILMRDLLDPWGHLEVV